MGPGQPLDRLGQRAVTGDLAVVVAVGADQIGQDLRIAAVGLGPRAAMPAAVAVDHLRVDRIHLVAGGHQRPDEQPAVGLDPDRHLRRVHTWAATSACSSATPARPSGTRRAARTLPAWSSRHRSWWRSPQSTPRKTTGILLCSGLLS
jgi:hypothetical protein